MSDTYRVEVFDAEGSNPRLRWSGPGGVSAQRPLVREEVEALVAAVADRYLVADLDLPVLGAEIYRWLDGPTQRWVQAARARQQPICLYVEAPERLRAVPWEVAFQEGFIAVHSSVAVSPVRAASLRVGPVREPANRPLRVLFMASSPVEVEPVLAFEREEAVILQAAAGRIEVVVEESGSLEGLRSTLEWFGPGYFDVLHLSGHARLSPAGPRFLMEDPGGRAREESPAAIAATIQGRWPGLVFLSGCSTGASLEAGTVASMAESLVEAGAPAVLGWALPVGDTAASDLAATLYGELAAGLGLGEAVARARAALFTSRSGFWHLLRLYADASPLIAPVTAPGTRGRVRLRARAAEELFLDPAGQVKVADRHSFVGRRRDLQALLRQLRPDDASRGPQVALVHGMGGLGKSTLVARLLERMRTTHPQHAVWVGKVDAQEVNRLTDLLNLPDSAMESKVNELLAAEGTLENRLRLILDGPLADTACVFVLDDFESGNVDADGHGGYTCTAQALEVVRAFANAIRRAASPSRLLVTSRYDVALPDDIQVHRLPISELQDNDLQKKLTALPNLGPLSLADPDLVQRAITAAAGVPRLLERLDVLLASPSADAESMITAIENTEIAYREELLLRRLLHEQPTQVRAAIALTSVYEIAVPRDAVLALSPEQPIGGDLDAAVAVGLVQAGLHPTTNEQRYLVSALVRPLLVETDDHLHDEQLTQAQARGAQFLYQQWFDADGQ